MSHGPGPEPSTGKAEPQNDPLAHHDMMDLFAQANERSSWGEWQ